MKRVALFCGGQKGFDRGITRALFEKGSRVALGSSSAPESGLLHGEMTFVIGAFILVDGGLPTHRL